MMEDNQSLFCDSYWATKRYLHVLFASNRHINFHLEIIPVSSIGRTANIISDIKPQFAGCHRSIFPTMHCDGGLYQMSLKRPISQPTLRIVTIPDFRRLYEEAFAVWDDAYRLNNYRAPIPVNYSNDNEQISFDMSDRIYGWLSITQHEPSLSFLFFVLFVEEEYRYGRSKSCRPSTKRSYPALPPSVVLGDSVFGNIEKSAERPSICRPINDNQKRSTASVEPMNDLHDQSPYVASDLTGAFGMCKVASDG